MYIVINNIKYKCSKRLVTDDSVEFYSVMEKPPKPETNVEMFRDDGFKLSTDIVSDYLRADYSNYIFKLTNKPLLNNDINCNERIYSNSQKRKEAYENGRVPYDFNHEFFIEFHDEFYTCNKLIQLGLQYQFIGEEETANAIKNLVKDKIKEIRKIYPIIEKEK